MLLSLVAIVGGAAAPASAAEPVAFSVDDFSGKSMGDLTLVAPTANSCQPSHGNTIQQNPGNLQIFINTHLDASCDLGSIQLKWTAPVAVNIEQGGADRIAFQYAYAVPDESGVASAGIRLEDINGLVATGGGMPINGGSLGGTIQALYVQADPNGPRAIDFPQHFDKKHVKSVTLEIAATKNDNQPIQLALRGIAENVALPGNLPPVIHAEDTYVFPVDTPTEVSFTATGTPFPSVALVGVATWLDVGSAAGSSETKVTLSGTPADYADFTINFTASVPNEDDAKQDIRIVVPSPVDVDYTSTTAELDEEGPVVLGTASATPAAGIIGAVSGLPAGTALAMDGTDVVLTGAPTESGTFQISAIVGHDWATQSFERTLVVGEAPELAAVDSAVVARGAAIAQIDLSATGYPAPMFSSTDLPPGLSLSSAGALTGTPTTNGDYAVTFTATNVMGEDSQQNVIITVGNGPVLAAIDDVNLERGFEISRIALPDSGFPSSVLTTSELPDGLSLTDLRAIEGTPTTNGITTVTVTATNDLGLDEKTFKVTVGDAPVLERIANAQVVHGEPIDPISAQASGFPTPTFISTALPVGLTLSADGVIEGTPTATGLSLVTVTATNVFGSEEQTFEIEVGDPPVLTLPSAVEIVAFGAYVLGDVVSDADAVVTATGLPDGIAVVTDADGVRVSGTATLPDGVNELTGTAEISAVSDFGSDATSFEWAVVRHEAPVVTLPTEMRLTVGDDVDLSIAATGLPAPTVTLEDLPPGLTWVPGESGGSIVGSPTAAGSFTANVIAVNGVGGDVRVPVTFVVGQPVITLSLSGASMKPGDSLEVSGSGFVPGDTVAFWLHSEPVLVATGTADALGVLRVSVVIPQDTPAGDHTLVAVAATGATGSAPLTVIAVSTTLTPGSTAESAAQGGASVPTASAPVADTLSSTGGETYQFMAVALIALALGASLQVVRRRHS